MGTKTNPGRFDCYANAAPDEPMFVLLARDPVACFLVRAWALLRAGDIDAACGMMRAGGYKIRNGAKPLIRQGDAKYDEAIQCAESMFAWQNEHNALHEGRQLKPPETTFLSGQGFTSEERERILAETRPQAAPDVEPHVLEFSNILGSKSAQAHIERYSGEAPAKAKEPMRLLNIGAGGTLPNRPWINVDYPHEHPEMDNYVRHDASKPLPFPDNWADGLIACHFLEHFECLKAVEILQEFYRVLKPGAVCRIVVPDASYHRKVYAEDLADPIGNAMRLFGEPLAGRDRAKQKLEVGRKDKDDTFMSFALFWADHKQLFTEDSLWCELVQAGFQMENIFVAGHQKTAVDGHSCSASVALLDNRELFSLRLEAVK